MHKSVVALLIPVFLMTAACNVDNQRIGTLAGAAGGALAGRAIGGEGTGGTVGLILGAVVGGYLGGEAGKWLDNRDKERMAETTNRTLENGMAGQGYTWTNPDSGNRGTVTAQQSFRNSSGQVCRDFTSSAVSAQGQSATAAGTACKQPDGTWRIVRG